MARSDLLVSLVRAGVSGDRDALRTSAEALVADARAKKHYIAADRIQRALPAVPVTPAALTATSSHLNSGNGREAILGVEARLSLDDLLLTLPARESARQLIEAHQRADVLRASGFEPRHSVLLAGPPGNGKTSFAESIAGGLGLPFFIVRHDALIGSYLGETNARLRKPFDYVRTQPSILFFDGFDAIGKERGDNHGELLDRAVWRRFQMRVAMPAAGKAGIFGFPGQNYIELDRPPPSLHCRRLPLNSARQATRKRWSSARMSDADKYRAWGRFPSMRHCTRNLISGPSA